jgi:two-component system, cell cycle response regulator DivK
VGGFLKSILWDISECSRVGIPYSCALSVGQSRRLSICNVSSTISGTYLALKVLVICNIRVKPPTLHNSKREYLPMQGNDPQGSAPRGVILIVEDNELNLKLLKDLLDFHGYSTVVTGWGTTALDLARQQPDLILLDIQLPDISGTEVARRLKADVQTRAIPIIAVTAFAMPGERINILDSVCDAYLSKPINVQEFLALVEHHIDKEPKL